MAKAKTPKAKSRRAATPKPKSKPKPKPKPKPRSKAPAKARPPTTKHVPATPAGEQGFDRLADDFVAAVKAAALDEARLREAIARAIKGFYDAMEAAGQERGERSGEFYWVDAVAIEDTGREVPLHRVSRELGDGGEVADRVIALWDEVQLGVR